LITYWTDFWNLIDIFFNLGIVILEILILTTTHNRQKQNILFSNDVLSYGLKVALSIFTILAWIKAPFYLTISDRLGPIIVAITRMGRDILMFLILAVVFLVGFSQMFTYFQNELNETYVTIGDTLLTLLAMSLSSINFFTGVNGVNAAISNFFLIIYLLLIRILLVNLLISMLGTTYQVSIEEGIQISRGTLVELYLQYKKSYWVPPFNWLKALFDFGRFIHEVVLGEKKQKAQENVSNERERKRSVEKLLFFYMDRHQEEIRNYFEIPRERTEDWDIFAKFEEPPKVEEDAKIEIVNE